MSRLLGALGGEARLVLVVGDAGVGKTRFASEGMARAAAAGLVMVRGECLPLAGTLPFLPVAAALGELAGVDDGSMLEAALGAAAPFVRVEVARLLPQLGAGDGRDPGGRSEGWQRQRLFSAVAELLNVVAREAAVGLVIEDVHWADSATLDCLTFLARTRRRGRVAVVATCRSDETPLQAHVAAWLAHVRGGAMEEIRLGPLSRAEVAEQVAALAGGTVLARVVDELYVRGEGNPFFTEQLVAAGLAGQDAGPLSLPAGLPARLAELLAARAGRCGGDAGAVLAALAVAGRPLSEELLCAVAGLDVEAVRRGLRELAAARLLAADTAGGGHRPRHALLSEAVAAGLLPGERAVLHERAARALEAAGEPAAEVAGHWRSAGRPAEELAAQVAAAAAAERVFGYAEAAAHWQRAIELCHTRAQIADAAGIDVPRLYTRGIDALYLSGDGVRAAAVAEEAYRRFAGHPDPATAAVACHRAAYFRALDAPAAGLPLIEEALRLFEQASPSSERAEAWLHYARIFLVPSEGWARGSLPALNQALEIAEAAGATALIPRVLADLAHDAFLRGQVEEGRATLQRGWALAQASDDGSALVWLAVSESDALLKLAQFRNAADLALGVLERARQTGLGAWDVVSILAVNACEGLLALGCTAEAATLIEPLTTRPLDRDHWVLYEARAEIDLLRGDIDAAARQRQLIDALPARSSSAEFVRESSQRAAELALWAARPGDALDEIQQALALFQAPDLTMVFFGRLLTTGMRACADLAERARAGRDEPAVRTAHTAAAGLASWADQMGGVPFTIHPHVATIAAERATWDAERTRLAGTTDPAAWGAAAKSWQGLGCPHRAGYAWWRQAEAQLNAGQPASAAAPALRAAAAAADGHAPLLAQVRKLAQRARIPLQPPASVSTEDGLPSAGARAPYDLTNRELAVLRLLAAGRTNAQIGADLYISPKTASVHVTSIFRKLGVSGRVQAAALAERAGLLAGPAA